MLIRTVIEDTSRRGLPTEHGLCLWIEACGRKFFFDLGQGALFADNAASMGINPQEAEFVVISHGHYDHGGGLSTFLALNDAKQYQTSGGTAMNHGTSHTSQPPIYIHKKAFGAYYSERNGRFTYRGLPHLQDNERMRLTDGTVCISDGLTLFSGCSGKEFFSPANRRILKEVSGQFVCDDFCHEQSLILQEGENNVLIAGCAHGGILNIISRAEEITRKPVTHVVGGMHVVGVNDRDFIDGLAHALKARNCMCYTCHCTGSEAYEEMKDIMGDRISYISAGDSVRI
ncbi:MAG: MBL fold metallo-hydrolase [Bacteroidaceae bacterium]|nr:MBL fold metallo-hydrolase [Bacteroidaceae bacterium]